MATILKEPEVRPAPSPAREWAVPTWWQKHRKLVILLALAAVGVTIAMVAAMAMMRGGRDNVSTSPSAAAAAPAAPASSADKSAVSAAAPAAPVAAAPSAVTTAASAKGLAAGKFPASQIKASSSNLVLAVFAAGLEGDGQTWSRYVPRSSTADKLYVTLTQMGSKGYAFVDEYSWIQVGGVINRNDLDFKVIRPSDGPEGQYRGEAILALPSPEGSIVTSVHAELDLEKTAHGNWNIVYVFSSRQDLWNGDAFNREIKRMKNTEGNVFSVK